METAETQPLGSVLYRNETQGKVRLESLIWLCVLANGRVCGTRHDIAPKGESQRGDGARAGKLRQHFLETVLKHLEP